MAFAFTSAAAFPAPAARSMLLQGVGSAAASGARVLLVGSAPSGRTVALSVAVPLPGDGGATATARRLRCAATGDHASPSDEDKQRFQGGIEKKKPSEGLQAFLDSVDKFEPTSDEDKQRFQRGMENKEPWEGLQAFLDSVDKFEPTSDEDTSFFKAMEEERARIQAVFSACNKKVLQRLADTAKCSLRFLGNILRDHGLSMHDDLEVVGISDAFLEVLAQSEGGYASADSVLAAIYGVQKLSGIFTAQEFEVPLTLRYFTGDLSDEEDKASHLRDLAIAYEAMLSKLVYSYYKAKTSPAARPILRNNCPAILVENDENLMENLRATAKDSEAMIAEMLLKDRQIPLTDLAKQELRRIGILFVKLDKECSEGYAASGSITAAMDGLKRAVEILAGRDAAEILLPHIFNGFLPIKNKPRVIWYLAAAFEEHLTEAKLCCSTL